MIVNPQTHYDQEYWESSKPYRVVLPDGTIETRLYQNPSLHWDGFGAIANAILDAIQAPAAPLLDIGCGAGSFLSFLQPKIHDVYGVDISDYAVSKVPFALRGRVIKADITRDPLPSEWPEKYAVVSALDLVEHVYMEDQEKLWRTFKERTKFGGLLVLDVATAHRPSDEWIVKRGEEIPIEREWQSCSGHIAVLSPGYWHCWAEDRGWKLERDIMKRFEAWRSSTPGYDSLISWGPWNFMVFRHTSDITDFEDWNKR